MSEPDVPVTVTVAVPVVAVEEAVRVNVELPLVDTEAGLKEAVTPLGKPEAERETVPAKPLSAPMVIVLVPLAPCVTVTDVGFAEMLKSGAGAALFTPNTRSS